MRKSPLVKQTTQVVLQKSKKERTGARSRTRTGTDLSVLGILSPVCLPNSTIRAYDKSGAYTLDFVFRFFLYAACKHFIEGVYQTGLFHIYVSMMHLSTDALMPP